MNKQNQNGSIHVVIISITVLILLSAVGFLFWQNILNKGEVVKNDNEKTPSKVVESPPQVKMKEGQIDSLFPASLSWKYPETWSLQSEGGGPHTDSETATQTITMTSPSKKYQVVYQVGANGGLGGSCGRDSPYTGKIQHITRKQMKDFPDTIFIEYISDKNSGANGEVNFDGYSYKSAIHHDDQRTQQAIVGGSFCDIYLENIIKLSDIYDTQLLAADVKLKDIDTADGSLPKDLNIIKKQYSNTEYQQAVGILLSTKKSDR